MPERTPKDTGPKGDDTQGGQTTSLPPPAPQIIPADPPQYVTTIIVALVLIAVGLVLAKFH